MMAIMNFSFGSALQIAYTVIVTSDNISHQVSLIGEKKMRFAAQNDPWLAYDVLKYDRVNQDS